MQIYKKNHKTVLRYIQDKIYKLKKAVNFLSLQPCGFLIRII